MDSILPRSLIPAAIGVGPLPFVWERAKSFVVGTNPLRPCKLENVAKSFSPLVSPTEIVEPVVSFPEELLFTLMWNSWGYCKAHNSFTSAAY